MPGPADVRFNAWGPTGVLVDWSDDAGEPTSPLANRLGVAYDSEGRVQSVRLQLGGGITPTRLQRFAWSRWLATADAAYRLTRPNGNADSRATSAAAFTDQIEAARRGVTPAAIRPHEERHPGRKGYPRAHYEEVAARYNELRLVVGVTNPTKTISTERSVSLSTAKSWVRRARKLGLLPPGRPGRPG